MTAARLIVALLGTLLAFVASSFAHGHPTKRTRARARSTPAERTAYDAARPALERHCFECHASDGVGSRRQKAKAMKHLNMSRYPFGGHHARDAPQAIRRALLGDPKMGKQPTMPPDAPGSIQGGDLATILAWADVVETAARAAASPRSTAPGAQPRAHSH